MRSHFLRKAILFVCSLVFLLSCALFLDPPKAHADWGIYDDQCDGQPASTIANYYLASTSPAIPLRCGYEDFTGTTGFGYYHIKAEHGPFDNNMDDDIYYTISNARPQSCGQDSSYICYIYKGFIVVVDPSDDGDGTMTGIITAYSTE